MGARPAGPRRSKLSSPCRPRRPPRHARPRTAGQAWPRRARNAGAGIKPGSRGRRKSAVAARHGWGATEWRHAGKRQGIAATHFHTVWWRVHRVIRHSSGAIARCTAVEGEPPERAQELPVWMLDAAWCREMRRADEPVASVDALRALQALLDAVAGGTEETEHPPIRSAGSRPGERDASSPPPADSAAPPSGSVLEQSAHDVKLGAPSGSDPSGRDHFARAHAPRPRARAESGAGERHQ